MLCAAASPVKYQGKGAEHKRKAQAGRPDLLQLRYPIALRRQADVVAAGEVDLCEQERRCEHEERQSGEQARGALVGGYVHDGCSRRDAAT
jgi:hypothetical protein